MKKTVLILAVLVLAVSACIRDKIPEGAELGPGDRLPEFSVILDDGSVVSTGDLSGKVSVIVFFHTGCPDCQAELPVIQRIHDEFSPEAAVLCISREEDAADVFSTKRPYGVQSFCKDGGSPCICFFWRPGDSQRI